MNRALLVSSCFVFALACAPGDDGNADDADTDNSMSGMSADTSDTADTNETLPGDGDGDGDGDPFATIVGVVADAQGAALPNPSLQFCGPVDESGFAELCIPVTPEASDGSFFWGAGQGGIWNIKAVHGPADGRNFAGQAFQVMLNEGDALDFSEPPIVVPEVDSLSPIAGVTDVAIDDVLTITIDPDAAQGPDFLPPPELGGLLVDQQFWRVTEVEGSAVLAGWSFSPFGIKSTMGGFTFTVADGLGLDPGAAVNFWEIEKDNGELHNIATGTVNGDASAIDLSPIGDGLHELTWLIVTGA